MAKIRFRSLPSKPFCVAVSQSGSKVEATFDPEGTGGMTPDTSITVGTATIKVNRNRGTAPAGFFFSIRTEGFEKPGDPDFDPYSDLHYRWTFSDPGWYTRHDTEDLPWGRWYDVAGEKVLISDGTVPKGIDDVTFLGNDKNIAYGPHCSHVFAPTVEDFGGQTTKVFEVCCEIRTGPTEKPAYTTAPFYVTIDNPDQVFPRTATFCVSNGGVRHGDEPLDASVYSTLSAALVAAQPHVRRRFLLRRGEKHAIEAGTSLGGNVDKLAFGSYGSSELPATVEVPEGVEFGKGLLMAWGSDANDPREVILFGIDLLGPYDPSDPYSISQHPPRGITTRPTGGGAWTAWDIKSTGFYSSFATFNNENYRNIHFGNCFIGDYFDYGIFMHNNVSHVGLAGVFIKQHPATVDGQAKWPTTPPFTASHAPIRISQFSGPVSLNLCDFRSIGGWGGSLFQPSLRLGGYQTEANEWIEEAVVDRLRAEGGDVFIQGVGKTANPTNRQYSGPAVPRRYIFDKIIAVTPQIQSAGSLVAFHVTGPVVRNCIIVSPNMPVITRDLTEYPNNTVRSTGTFWLLKQDSTYEYSALNFEHPLHFYNNTFVEMQLPQYQSSGNYFDVKLASYFTEKAGAWNNVFAFPNGTNVYKDDTDFAVPHMGGGSNYMWVPDGSSSLSSWMDLSPLCSPTIKSFQQTKTLEFGLPPNTEVGIPDDAFPVMRPSPASPFVGSADAGPNARIAVDDFFGRIRTRLSKGAVEPL